MAVSTAITTLNYGVTQIETATVVGTITGSGNATVIVTASGVTGSPITFNVAVLSGDTAQVVAQKIRTDLEANSDLTDVYNVSGLDDKVVLTRKLASADDATLNISVANGTCTGLTNDLTSDNTRAGVAYTKLVDIISYPDLGSTPSKLDTTDLSQPKFKTNILGLQEAPDLTFECNYDEASFNTINGLTANYAFQLLFGSADGQFTWEGDLQVYAMGAGVDEVRKMTVVCSTSTPIEFSTN